MPIRRQIIHLFVRFTDCKVCGLLLLIGLGARQISMPTPVRRKSIPPTPGKVPPPGRQYRSRRQRPWIARCLSSAARSATGRMVQELRHAAFCRRFPISPKVPGKRSGPTPN